MSVRVMTWVWTQSNAEATDRLVLLAIADCANDDGRDAYPSLATLADKARIHKRTVQRSIDSLVAMGELAIQEHGGPGKPNRYRVTMQPGQPVADGGVPPTSPVGTPPIRQDAYTAQDRQGVGTPPTSSRHSAHSDVGTVPTKPSVEPSITIKEPSTKPTTGTGTRIPDDFATTPEMIAWARKETPLVGAKETDAFVDYWRARPGAGGRKTDWVATWRNWMRKAQADAERGRPARASPGLVEHNGLRVRPETAQRIADRARFEAMDQAAEQRRAIEGSPT